MNTTPNSPITALKKRRFLAALGVVVLLLLGLVYAWSIFVPPLEQEFGWLRSQTSMAFSICMAMFCVGGIFSGLMLRRFQTRVVLAVCAVGLLAGFGLASKLTSLAGLYLSYGLLVGFSVGAGYNAIISAVLRWFPEKVGLISGLLMMGFGLGAMVLGTVGSALIESIGWRATFMAIGVTFSVIIMIAALFIAPPKAGEIAPATRGAGARQNSPAMEVDTKDMLRMPSFWIFFCWAVVISAAGLMLIGHAVPLVGGLGATPERAAFFAGFISIFNGLGRVIMGFTFDRLGYKWVMRMVSSGFIVSGALLVYALNAVSIPLTLAGFVITGLSYGGMLPANASVIGTFYGMRNYAMNFSMINSCLIVASFLGPYLAGVLHTASGNYNAMVLIMSAFGALGLALSLMLRKPMQDLPIDK